MANNKQRQDKTRQGTKRENAGKEKSKGTCGRWQNEKDGLKKQDNEKREKTKRAKGINKSAAAACAQVLRVYFAANKTNKPQCNQTTWHPPRAPEKMANMPTRHFGRRCACLKYRLKECICYDGAIGRTREQKLK